MYLYNEEFSILCDRLPMVLMLSTGWRISAGVWAPTRIRRLLKRGRWMNSSAATSSLRMFTPVYYYSRRVILYTHMQIILVVLKWSTLLAIKLTITSVHKLCATFTELIDTSMRLIVLWTSSLTSRLSQRSIALASRSPTSNTIRKYTVVIDFIFY